MFSTIISYIEVIVVCLIKIITKTLYYYVSIINLNHNIKFYKIPRMIISNHSSYYDIFTLLYIFENDNKTSAVKKEKNRIFKLFLL